MSFRQGSVGEWGWGGRCTWHCCFKYIKETLLSQVGLEVDCLTQTCAVGIGLDRPAFAPRIGCMEKGSCTLLHERMEKRGEVSLRVCVYVCVCVIVCVCMTVCVCV